MHDRRILALQHVFPGEGKASDYAVSSLFGTDFRLNLFSGSLDRVKPRKEGIPTQLVHVSR